MTPAEQTQLHKTIREYVFAVRSSGLNHCEPKTWQVVHGKEAALMAAAKCLEQQPSMFPGSDGRCPKCGKRMAYSVVRGWNCERCE